MRQARSFVLGTPLSGEDFFLPWSGRGIDYTEEDIAAVVEVMRHADPLTQGHYLEHFEKVFSDYHGGVPAFATSSCAASLELAAMLIEVEPGDEIIMPAHTYVASAIPFARRGARLVWADIDPDTRVLSEETISAKISPNTKAVVMVHLYGLSAPMDGIVKLSEKHGFTIIEDCAQSLGGQYRGKRSGTHGHIACYSFHAQKNISTLGEGGMITVQSPEHGRLIPGLRHNGHHEFSADRQHYWKPAMVNVDFDIEGVWPFNFSIGEAQCALGIQLMKRIDDLNQRRYRNARSIIDSLADIPELAFQKIPEGSNHTYHLLSARYDGASSGTTRDQLIELLVDNYKIQPVVQFYPLYRYPMFVRAGMGEADCPNTDEFFDNMLSLPFFEWYGGDEIEYLIASVRKAVLSLRNG